MRSYNSLANLHSLHPLSPSLGHHRSVKSDDDVGRMSTPHHIQSHLFNAFLSGRTTDVSLRVRGSWEGIYRLHRVVLIQAGFFRSLFDGGFREGASSSKHGGQGEVSLIFDDPNITRPAFEICISRLYGGGPTLYVDPRLVPTRRDPLTPSFPRVPAPNDTPSGHFNATPRFLLSLLATAIYLSIPSLVSQAIQLLLSSLSPYSVIRCLNFAVGKGIGEKSDADSDIVPGLEDVCQEIRNPGSLRSRSVRSGASKRSKPNTVVDPLLNEHEPAQKEPAPDTDSHSDESDSDTEADKVLRDDADDGPVFVYGAVSNKLGEAAACWLCRWGADMIAYEEVPWSNASGYSSSPAQEQDPPGRRRATESSANGSSALTSVSREDTPLIWRRGGIDAKWARAVLSSDAFFVRDERERYDLAKRVVELRRRVSIDPLEEKEWDELFANGIHYMHMTLNDLIEITQNVSPTTGRPYAPTSVIQAAHWNQSVLRHRITYRQNSSSSSPTTPPRSPIPARDGSLGLSQTTTDLLANSSDHKNISTGGDNTYYSVPVDSSSRIGDTTGLEDASMDQLFNSPVTPSSPSPKPSTTKGFTSYGPDTFFGILSSPRNADSCVAADPSGQASWSPFPPIRFGVEFWGLETLQEKSRLTSQTIWYAGSLFNVYVQVVRKKGLQLGMYLHRLSSVETIPIPSSPPAPAPISASVTTSTGDGQRWTVSHPVNIPTSASTPSLHRPISRGTVNGGAASRSTTPAPSYSPPSTASTSPPRSHTGGLTTTRTPAPPTQPYRDPREAVRAHFTLLCSAPTGGALTRFTSAPDAFYVGRSWGWKSSALQTEELVDVHAESDSGSLSPGAVAASSKKECSLRATVVLGLV